MSLDEPHPINKKKLKLEILDERRLRNGVVHLPYRTRR